MTTNNPNMIDMAVTKKLNLFFTVEKKRKKRGIAIFRKKPFSKKEIL
jgi:hypothetical protein